MGQHSAHQALRLRLMQIVGQMDMRHHHVVLDLVEFAQRFIATQIAGDQEGFRRMVEVLFIEGQPVLHLIAVTVDHLLAKADKGVHDPAVGKTVVTLRQRQRHIKVIQADHRFNTAGNEFIDKLMVERDPLFIEFAVPFRAHPAPGDLEAVAVHAQILHQIEIFAKAMIGVGRDLPVRGEFRRLTNIVHRHPLAPLVPRPLRLHAGDGITP
ncbi:Uncharacterised protein [Klebsiella aerogenes]|nr:Uncharacterised protein [Klebsiella aerogenes]